MHISGERRASKLLDKAPYLQAFLPKLDPKKLVPTETLKQELTHLSYVKAHLELAGRLNK